MRWTERRCLFLVRITRTREAPRLRFTMAEPRRTSSVLSACSEMLSFPSRYLACGGEQARVIEGPRASLLEQRGAPL